MLLEKFQHYSEEARTTNKSYGRYYYTDNHIYKYNKQSNGTNNTHNIIFNFL